MDTYRNPGFQDNPRPDSQWSHLFDRDAADGARSGTGDGAPPAAAARQHRPGRYRPAWAGTLAFIVGVAVVAAGCGPFLPRDAPQARVVAGQQATPSEEAVPSTPVPEPSPTLVAVVLATPAPTATAAPTRQLVIFNTGGDGLKMRASAGDGRVLTVLPEGARVENLGESTKADGMTWLKVKAPDGQVGYVAQPWVQAVNASGGGGVLTPTPASLNYFLVGNTGGDGVYVRRTPALADRLVAWPDNTRLEDLGEQVTGDGQTWQKVRDPRGTVGYVPVQWLVRP